VKERPLEEHSIGRVVITGAGVAGLTLAERLLVSGRASDVTMVEREEAPGGLARTFEKEGFCFDIGPHRFHTSDMQVEAYLLEILGDDHVTIPRVSSVYMAGRYLNWPITLGAVLGLPAPVIMRSLLDLFARHRTPSTEQTSFADHIIARYGRNLYEYFFRSYTRKFTGMDAELLHPDWAAAGVNRAVIDKRVRADSLFALIRGILLPKPVATSFYYTSKGGIQTFCDMQLRRILDAGGKVRLGVRADGLEITGGAVTGVHLAGGSVLPADKVYWSAPVSLLYPDSGFRFMNTVLFNAALVKPQRNQYQWCYFGQEDIVFSRLTVPRHFRPDTVPEGRDSIVAEISLADGSPGWTDPETLRERVILDLERVGALKREDILFMDWVRVPETYPLYDLGYRERLPSLSLPVGLELLGRCGSFWYNNMDHSIGQALAMAGGGSFRKEFWEG
jgi:protoporphyrinogen oxidase